RTVTDFPFASLVPAGGKVAATSPAGTVAYSVTGLGTRPSCESAAATVVALPDTAGTVTGPEPPDAGGTTARPAFRVWVPVVLVLAAGVVVPVVLVLAAGVVVPVVLVLAAGVVEPVALVLVAGVVEPFEPVVVRAGLEGTAAAF